MDPTVNNQEVEQHVEVSTRSSAGSGQRRQQQTGLNGDYWSPVESENKRRQKRQIVATDQNVDKAKRSKPTATTTTTIKPTTSFGSERPESTDNIMAPVVQIASKETEVTQKNLDSVAMPLVGAEEDASKYLMKYEDFQWKEYGKQDSGLVRYANCRRPSPQHIFSCIQISPRTAFARTSTCNIMTFMITEGKLTIDIGSGVNKVFAKRGDLVYVPPMTTYTLRNKGPLMAEMMILQFRAPDK